MLKKFHIVLICAGTAIAGAGISAGICYALLNNHNDNPTPQPEPEPVPNYYSLSFSGVHVKMLDEYDEEVTKPLVFPDDKIFTFKLVPEDDTYDVPPEVIVTNYNDEVVDEGYVYDNATGIFQIKFSQNVIITAKSFTKDVVMVINYDYHADSNTVGLCIDRVRDSNRLWIDWGDGSDEEEILFSGSLHQAHVLRKHTYSGEKNNYEIILRGNSTINYFTPIVDNNIDDSLSGIAPNDSYIYAGDRYLSKMIMLRNLDLIDRQEKGLSSSVMLPNIEHLVIGHLVTKIPHHLFNNLAITKLFIPKNVLEIQNYAFRNACNLSEIIIEDETELQKINSYAFGSNATDILNYKVTSLKLPSSIGQINGYAFVTLAGLEEVTCLANNPPAQENPGDIFRSKYLKHIYVQSNSVDKYKEASGWSNFADIISAIPEE